MMHLSTKVPLAGNSQLHVLSATRQSRSRGRRVLVLLTSVVLVLVFLGYIRQWEVVPFRLERARYEDGNFDKLSNSQGDEAHKGTGFQWEQITPTEQLVYHPCYDEYQCARLELPMDWNRTDGTGSKIALAVIRLPAKVPVTDARYGGPIILNPGGPGGSGVLIVEILGKWIQTIADSPFEPVVDGDLGRFSAVEEEGKYFDIVSFDPRGVNNTSPPFSCFPDSWTRYEWRLQVEAEGILGSTDGAFDTHWSRHEARSASCSEPGQPQGDDEEWIGHFMNTSPVIADMVELVERHGEWREQETERLLAAAETADSSCLRPSDSEIKTIEQRNQWLHGQEKLQYWGFSYGTVLGATFAAMQPHRLHRAVIDGVCDTLDYYLGNWLLNLQDTDVILDRFCEYCHKAGPKSCPLAIGGGPQDIKDRFEALQEAIKSNPVAVPASGQRGPEIITYSDVNFIVMRAIYKPLEIFPRMAQLLADLSYGNGSSSAEFKRQEWKSNPFAQCLGRDTSSKAVQCTIPGDNHSDASDGILCTDGEAMKNTTKEDYRKYWSTLRNQSALLGDFWASIRLPCVGWKARPKWRFDGPFTGETAHPLLFIGNTLDPVTPLRNAHTVSKGFPNSVVLQQDSEGHCSIAMPSLCTAKAVRRYFQTGALPRPGTVCEPDERPFQASESSSRENALSLEDHKLLEALRMLRRDFGRGGEFLW